MLLGHRRSRFGDARLECDRCIVPEGVFRCTVLDDLLADEAVLLPALGRGTEDRGRGKLLVALHGPVLLTVEGRPVELATGDLVGVDALAEMVCHGGDDVTMTIDWPVGTASFRGRTRLAPAAIERLWTAVRELRRSQSKTEALITSLEGVSAALAAEGVVLEGFMDAMRRSVTSAADQAYLSKLDHILGSLEAGPAASDWDATRRTLTRRTHSFHRQYSLFGVRRDTDWRSVKEFHRLLTAAAFVTRPGATLAEVARAVGYRSPASLCAAFAQLGLPSPGTLRSLSIAA